MPVVAITGSICSGKSTVLRILKEKGAKTVSLDRWVHRYYRDKKSVVYQKIKKFFPSVLNCRGTILRKKLGRIVFSDYRLLKKLESVVHPVIVRDLKRWVFCKKCQRGVYVIEIPLLFEKDLENIFDSIILVSASQSNLVKRIKKKFNISHEEAKKRLSYFMPTEKKKKKVDFVINNDCSLLSLKKKVGVIWRRLKRG